MSQDNARAAMRPSQTETNNSDQNFFGRGCSLPTTGPYPLSFWAGCFACKDATVREWIREYDIPYCEVGRCDIVIWAEDLWEAFPRRRPSQLPPKKRGGARPKRKD